MSFNEVRIKYYNLLTDYLNSGDVRVSYEGDVMDNTDENVIGKFILFYIPVIENGVTKYIPYTCTKTDDLMYVVCMSVTDVSWFWKKGEFKGWVDVQPIEDGTTTVQRSEVIANVIRKLSAMM